MALVYKICGVGEWSEALSTGLYRGSSDDHRDGFIHLSTRGQVPGTLAKHFIGRGGLVLIAVRASDLAGRLRYEGSRGGEVFPHLYGDLPLKAVAWTRPIDDDRRKLEQLFDDTTRAEPT
jgi:uncharacterized protein (DUF952 family)